jgi:hypothetical protein
MYSTADSFHLCALNCACYKSHYKKSLYEVDFWDRIIE